MPDRADKKGMKVNAQHPQIFMRRQFRDNLIRRHCIHTRMTKQEVAQEVRGTELDHRLFYLILSSQLLCRREDGYAAVIFSECPRGEYATMLTRRVTTRLFPP